MKNKITLAISRGKSFLDIYHKGEKIGTIMVSEQCRTNQVSLSLGSDAEITRFNIKKFKDFQEDPGNSEEFWNKEEFNK